jgi:hypothetical protein
MVPGESRATRKQARRQAETVRNIVATEITLAGK